MHLETTSHEDAGPRRDLAALEGWLQLLGPIAVLALAVALVCLGAAPPLYT